jgi:hypothetical protein
MNRQFSNVPRTIPNKGPKITYPKVRAGHDKDSLPLLSPGILRSRIAPRPRRIKPTRTPSLAPMNSALASVHILDKSIHIVDGQRPFEGRHRAPAIKDYVPQLFICSRRTARKSLFSKQTIPFSKQTVQRRRLFQQVQIRCVVTWGAELLIHVRGSETRLVSLDSIVIATRAARRAGDEADHRN